MPTAHPDLRAKFPDGEQEAFDVIRTRFTVMNNGIIVPVYGMSWALATERERDAITYLCDEWDYGYGDCAWQ